MSFNRMKFLAENEHDLKSLPFPIVKDQVII